MLPERSFDPVALAGCTAWRQKYRKHGFDIFTVHRTTPWTLCTLAITARMCRSESWGRFGNNTVVLQLPVERLWIVRRSAGGSDCTSSLCRDKAVSGGGLQRERSRCGWKTVAKPKRAAFKHKDQKTFRQLLMLFAFLLCEKKRPSSVPGFPTALFFFLKKASLAPFQEPNNKTSATNRQSILRSHLSE